MATWSYDEALKEGLVGLNLKEFRSEMELVKKVSQRTENRLKEYDTLYGYVPYPELIDPHRYEGGLFSVSAEILDEAVSFNEAVAADVDCDEWELERRMRSVPFKPSWFAKWLFQNGFSNW